MPILWCRCSFCDASFESDCDTDECPDCAEKWRRQIAAAKKETYEGEPWKWSRSAMQERLSVSGSKDE